MGSAYQFHSWRVFVLVCAFPSVFAIGALTTMPESPRFFLEVSGVGGHGHVLPGAGGYGWRWDPHMGAGNGAGTPGWLLRVGKGPPNGCWSWGKDPQVDTGIGTPGECWRRHRDPRGAAKGGVGIPIRALAMGRGPPRGHGDGAGITGGC